MHRQVDFLRTESLGQVETKLVVNGEGSSRCSRYRMHRAPLHVSESFQYYQKAFALYSYRLESLARNLVNFVENYSNFGETLVKL